MKPCVVCGESVAELDGYCSQECRDAAATQPEAVEFTIHRPRRTEERDEGDGLLRSVAAGILGLFIIATFLAWFISCRHGCILPLSHYLPDWTRIWAVWILAAAFVVGVPIAAFSLIFAKDSSDRFGSIGCGVFALLFWGVIVGGIIWAN
jgi:hypothetical protein